MIGGLPVGQLGAIEASLAHLALAEPALLERRSLLRRRDTKFLMCASRLPSLLLELATGYQVLPAGEALVAHYETLYFDTPGLDFYHDHLRGRRPRHKVRIRHYPDRRLTYLEIKTKTNHDVTVKRRVERPYGESHMTHAELRLALELTAAPAPRLLPEAWTNFRRITLLGRATDERVTIDLGVCLERRHGHERISRRLDGALIVEVKQRRVDSRTPAMLALRHHGARRVSASKYATAIALLVPGVRRNRFLPVLRRFERSDPWPSC